jgi:hypothetical protein
MLAEIYPLQVLLMTFSGLVNRHQAEVIAYLVSVHGIIQNLFRVGRHLMRAANYRILRARAFLVWNAVTCA